MVDIWLKPEGLLRIEGEHGQVGSHQEKDPERQRSWSNLAGCEGTTSQWDAPRHQRGEDVCGLREELQCRGHDFGAPHVGRAPKVA